MFSNVDDSSRIHGAHLCSRTTYSSTRLSYNMLLSYFLLLTFAIARLVFYSIPFFLLFFGILRDVALPLGQLLSSSALLFHIDGRRPLYEYNEVSSV